MFYKYNASAFGSDDIFCIYYFHYKFIQGLQRGLPVVRELSALNMYMLQHFMNNNFNNLNYQRLSTASLLMELFIVAIVFLMYKIEGRYGKSF